jgi:hypothetical protein
VDSASRFIYPFIDALHEGVTMRIAISRGMLFCLCLLAGCFMWTQDSQGHLQSVGLPGVPVWQSSAPPPPISPTQLGFTPDEAAQMSGPVLVIPAASGAYHYRFYQSGQNHCAEDVQKLMASRAAYPTSDPAPYCSDKPTAPTAKSGSFMGF